MKFKRMHLNFIAAQSQQNLLILTCVFCCGFAILLSTGLRSMDLCVYSILVWNILDQFLIHTYLLLSLQNHHPYPPKMQLL